MYLVLYVWKDALVQQMCCCICWAGCILAKMAQSPQPQNPQTNYRIPIIPESIARCFGPKIQKPNTKTHWNISCKTLEMSQKKTQPCKNNMETNCPRRHRHRTISGSSLCHCFASLGAQNMYTMAFLTEKPEFSCEEMCCPYPGTRVKSMDICSLSLPSPCAETDSITAESPSKANTKLFLRQQPSHGLQKCCPLKHQVVENPEWLASMSLGAWLCSKRWRGDYVCSRLEAMCKQDDSKAESRTSPHNKFKATCFFEG